MVQQLAFNAAGQVVNAAISTALQIANVGTAGATQAAGQVGGALGGLYEYAINEPVIRRTFPAVAVAKQLPQGEDLLTTVLGVPSAVGKAAIYETKPTEIQKVIDSPKSRQIAQKAFQAVEEKIYGYPDTAAGLVSKIVYNIPGTSVIQKSQRETFLETAKIEYMKQGYDSLTAGRYAKELADVQLAGGSIGEGLGALGVSAAAEKIGQKVSGKLISQAVKKAGGALPGGVRGAAIVTPRAVAGSAVGGVFEGATQQGIINVARGGELKPLDVARQGALGGVSAGFLSGAIVGPTFAGGALRRVGQGIDVGARIIDPYETPGEQLLKATGYSREIRIPVRRATALGGAVPLSIQEQQSSRRRPSQTPSRPSIYRRPGLISNIFGSTTPSTPQEESVFGFPVPVPERRPGSKIITEIRPDDIVPPTEQPQEQPQEVPSQTPAETIFPTNIPTQTPIVRGLFPPIPFPAFGAGNGGSVSRSGRLLYYNDLALAGRAFRRLL